MELTLYAVRNREGKWFRSKGYGGYGPSWVDDVNKAKLYSKLGQARARVTFWYNTYPEYGIPDIVVFKAEIAKVINEKNRQEEKLEKKQTSKKRAEVRRRKWAFEDAQRRLAEAQADLENLGPVD